MAHLLPSFLKTMKTITIAIPANASPKYPHSTGFVIVTLMSLEEDETSFDTALTVTK